MADPTIVRNRSIFSDSNALEAIGRAIHEIKSQDGLTWEDIGKVFGVSDDQAAKYANGMASMSIVTFGRGKREWNGRFTGYFDRLCVDSRPGQFTDQHSLTHLLAAASHLSHALEDGEITPSEVRANRTALENARDAINAQLAKLEVRAA